MNSNAIGTKTKPNDDQVHGHGYPTFLIGAKWLVLSDTVTPAKQGMNLIIGD